MKRIIFTGLAALSLLPFNAAADVTVKLPAVSGIDSLEYYSMPISKMISAKSRAELGLEEGKVPVVNETVVIPIGTDNGGYRVGFKLSENDAIDLFAAPGNNIVAEISSVSPFSYKLSGSPLAEGISEIVNTLRTPLEEKQRAMMAKGEPAQEDMMAIYQEYVDGLKDYINENPTSEATAYAVMDLPPEEMIPAFEKLSERAKSNILYPLAKVRYDNAVQNMEKERKQQELASGTHDAPAFTLKNVEGKDVSLSDFKGKWVILDFWGSWCIWCIKGFPELKEAYEKYNDELVIIGVDCNETEEAWKAGVAKYELPWVNVYCPDGNPLVAEYGIQGFPTKAIIDPEGKIRNITTGHNPDFFTALSNLIGK